MHKKTLLLSACAFIVMLCGCTPTGEVNTERFAAEMAKYGYNINIEEIYSTQQLKESCYIEGCKITLFSDLNGATNRLVLTCAEARTRQQLALMGACVKSCCGLDDASVNEILEQAKSETTMGINQKSYGNWLISFTSDSAGCCLVLNNLRLNPTQEPTVTVRSSEKASF